MHNNGAGMALLGKVNPLRISKGPPLEGTFTHWKIHNNGRKIISATMEKDIVFHAVPKTAIVLILKTHREII